MSRIFISYRREDSEIWAARLEESLKREFPSDQVFRDVTTIAPGVDFVDALDAALRETVAAIVVIGPSWLSVTDKKGNRRLDQPKDFIRQEVAASLGREGVRVFPVLVDGAQMPGEEDLPEPLKPLWRRNALDLTVRHWDNDVAELVRHLRQVPGLTTPVPSADSREDVDAAPHPSPPPVGPPSRRRTLWAGVTLLIVSGVVAIALSQFDLTGKKPVQPVPPLVTPPVAQPKDSGAPPSREATPQQPDTRAAAPPEKPASAVTLRGQDSYTKAFGFSENLVELAGTVQSLSAGRVRFEVLPAGAVVRPLDVMDAVAKGILDFAWVAPGQFAGKDVTFALVDSPPFGPAPADYLRWRKDPAVKRIIDELYSRHGVRAIPGGVIWLADLWTNQPIRTAADLKGRKIRTSGSLMPEIFNRAGASSVALPGGEIAPAMERGVIDSVQLLDPATGVKLGFPNFARALYFPGRLAPAEGIDLLVNPAKWEALDPAARRVVEEACERNAREMVEGGRDAQKVAVSTVALKGVVVEEFPRDVQDLLRRAWHEVVAKKRSNPMFERLYGTPERYSAGGR